MRVTDEMIDEELRPVGRQMRRMSRLTSVPMFRLMDFVLNFTNRNNKIEELRFEEYQIPRRDHTSHLRVCVHAPNEPDGPLPMFLYIHGGGFVMGSPEMSFEVIRKFIESRPCIIVSPAYRKSLEQPFPAALDDCYQTLLWMRDNAEVLGGNSDQIIVGGHSAGGGLTAAVSLRARTLGEVKIRLQLPIYPMLDDRNSTESMIDNDAPAWNEKMNKLGWRLYLKGTDEVPPEAAPARAVDYSELPTTITFVGDLDPFRDETVEYVQNLEAAGIDVYFKMFKGGYHGFELMAPNAQLSREADQFLYSTFAEVVDTMANADSVTLSADRKEP